MSRYWIVLVALVLVATLGATASASEDSEEEESSATYPGDADAARPHWQQARSAYVDGQYRDAVRGLERAYEIYQHPFIQFNLGQSHRRLGNFEEALTAYNRYIETSAAQDRVNRVYVFIGECHLGLDRREQANQAFRRYLALEEAGEMAEQVRRAIETGEPVSEQDRRDPEQVRLARDLTRRADAMWEAEQYQQAAELFLSGYGRWPEMHELLYNAALAYMDGELWQQAAETYQRYVRTPGAEHDAWAFLAECLHEEWNLAGALEAYQRYLQLEPTGTYADYAREYVQSIAPSPHGRSVTDRPTDEELLNAEQHYSQGVDHFENGDYEQARRAFEVAYMAVPDRNLYFNMGRCDEELGNWAAARTCYQGFLEAGDESTAAVVHLFLARVLLRLNQRSEASRPIRTYVDRARTEELPNEAADLAWARELLRDASGQGSGDED